MDDTAKKRAIAKIEQLNSEREHLQASVRRQRPKPTRALVGDSWSRAERLVNDVMAWGGDDRLTSFIDGLERTVKELRGSVARRTGDGRRQNHAQWEDWWQEKPMPHASGPVHAYARGLILSGEPYAFVLWVVASAYVAGHPPFDPQGRDPAEKLDRRHAHNLKRRVTAAWLEHRPGEGPPRVPVGWWRCHVAETDFGQVARLDWYPSPDP